MNWNDIKQIVKHNKSNFYYGKTKKAKQSQGVNNYE